MNNGIEMDITLKTYCSKCGIAWQARSLFLKYDLNILTEELSRMAKKLNTSNDKCCGKRLPILARFWEKDTR